MAKNKELTLEEKLREALIPKEELPYEIPESWEWVKLGSVGDYKKGPFGSSLTKSLFIPKNKNTIKVYEQKNAIQKNWKLGSYYISEEYFKNNMSSFEVKENDIIVSCAGTIGETYIMPPGIEKGIINQALMKIKLNENIDKKYYLFYFDYILKNLSNTYSKGSAIKNIPPFKIFKELAFILPPLEEQKRIVEKLEFMFEKINKAKELIQEVKENIENRKESILNKAFRGELTAEWRKNNQTEDAIELLKSINEEKIKNWEQACIEAEKSGKKKPSKPKIEEIENIIISKEEEPYEIPKNWKWVRLENVTSKITDGTHKTPTYIDDGVPFISVKNIKNNKIYFDDIKYISQEEHKELYKRCNPEKGDILITKSGTIGRTAEVKEEFEFSLFVSVALIKNYKNIILSKYLLYNTNDYMNKINIASDIKGGVIKNYHISDIKKQPIPLPPLKEQEEIVRILDEILEKESKIKELIELEEAIELLEKSILDKAFRGELGTQNKEDEPAIELLKKIL